MVHVGAEDRIDQVGKGHLAGLKSHQCQGGEQRHHALREIENAGCLENQHEAKGNQRIHHAGHQPVEHRFDKIENIRTHAAPPLLQDRDEH